ncbi:MAG: hypothetical protein ACR2KZ_12690 [Segetibacter sp.]
MPKDKNAQAVELISTPEKLLNQIIKDPEKREWAFNKITLEGPPHKQIQHTLVLNRLEKLASVIKKNSGVTLKFPKGQTIMLDGPEEETLPVTIPAKSLEALTNADEVIEKLSKGPAHEVLYTALLLQVIEAMITVYDDKVKQS